MSIRGEQDLEMVLVNMTKTKTRKSCKTKTKTKTFIFEENENIVKKYIFEKRKQTTPKIEVAPITTPNYVSLHHG